MRITRSTWCSWHIPHDSYSASYYCTALTFVCRVISPSTLGIDVKKLIMLRLMKRKSYPVYPERYREALQETLPELVGQTINAYNFLHGKAAEEVKVDIPFGE